MNWYYSQQGRATGPVTEDGLAEMCKQGRLSASDWIWHPGAAAWGAIEKLFPDALDPGRKATNVPAIAAPLDPAPAASPSILTATVTDTETSVPPSKPGTTTSKLQTMISAAKPPAEKLDAKGPDKPVKKPGGFFSRLFGKKDGN